MAGYKSFHALDCVARLEGNFILALLLNKAPACNVGYPNFHHIPPFKHEYDLRFLALKRASYGCASRGKGRIFFVSTLWLLIVLHNICNLGQQNRAGARKKAIHDALVPDFGLST